MKKEKVEWKGKEKEDKSVSEIMATSEYRKTTNPKVVMSLSREYF
jgi:hypothetical protein